jgi:hypothetical protein
MLALQYFIYSMDEEVKTDKGRIFNNTRTLLRTGLLFLEPLAIRGLMFVHHVVV